MSCTIQHHLSETGKWSFKKQPKQRWRYRLKFELPLVPCSRRLLIWPWTARLSKPNMQQPSSQLFLTLENNAKSLSRYIESEYSHYLLAAADTRVSVQNLAEALPVSSGIRLISHLNALKRLAKYAIDAFETRAKEVTSFATGHLKRPTLTSTPSRASNTVSRLSSYLQVSAFFTNAALLGMDISPQTLMSSHSVTRILMSGARMKTSYLNTRLACLGSRF